MTSPARTSRSPPGAAGSSTSSAPVAPSTPTARTSRLVPSGILDSNRPAGGDLAIVPARRRRNGRRAAPATRGSRRTGRRRAARRSRSGGRARPRAGWSSTPPARPGTRPRGQSALMPMPDDGPRPGRPAPSVSPQDSGDLAEPPARRAPGAPSTTMSFGHLSLQPARPAARPPPRPRRPSPGRRPRPAATADRAARYVGREAERQQQRGAARRHPGSTRSPATGGLLVGDGQAHLGGSRDQPGSDDVVGRGDRPEPLVSREKRDARRRHAPVFDAPPVPACVRPRPAARLGSSSAKALCRARTAVST